MFLQQRLRAQSVARVEYMPGTPVSGSAMRSTPGCPPCPLPCAPALFSSRRCFPVVVLQTTLSPCLECLEGTEALACRIYTVFIQGLDEFNRLSGHPDSLKWRTNTNNSTFKGAPGSMDLLPRKERCKFCSSHHRKGPALTPFIVGLWFQLKDQGDQSSLTWMPQWILWRGVWL